MKKKQFEHDYLMPFIDFAFMVIIIFIALLSIAYFTPPGSKGTDIVVRMLKPLVAEKERSEEKEKSVKEGVIKEKVKEIEYLETKLKTKKAIYEREIKALRTELESKEKMITQLKKEISILKAQLEKKVREVEELGYGKHEFTDLRK